MKKKKILQLAGILLLLVLIIVGIYIYSILPKPIGDTPELQSELFEAPKSKEPVQGKYLFKSAEQLASMIKSGEVTSIEVVKEFITYIKNNNWKFNSLVWMDEEEVLSQARLVDEKVMKGDTALPLLGVPITIKEQIFVKGFPSTLNNKQITIYPKEDAPIVKQLKASGAIVLGTTNLMYMVEGFQTFGEVYPTASNPYDTTRTPGGSTGGGAAAVAAGFTTMELGADIGGSIRIPAAFCGLWSLKPSYGALNGTQGFMPLELSKPKHFAMASPGPLTRTAKDLSLFWEALKNTEIDQEFQENIEWKAPNKSTIGDYKISWADEWANAKSGSDVKEKMETLIRLLEKEGALTSNDPPSSSLYSELSLLFITTYAHIITQNQPWLIRRFIVNEIEEKYGEGLIEGIDDFRIHALDPSEENWSQVQAHRKSSTAKLETYFEKYDLLVLPVSYGAAFKKCEGCKTIKGDDGIEMFHYDYVGFNQVFNATGHPSITVPMGLNEEGLPIGLQVVGSMYSEPELLHFAQLIEPLIPGFIIPKNLNK